MRDLIDLIQTLSEATGVGNLAPSEFKMRPTRFAKFIEKIQAQEPFTTVDDQEVVIDPAEAKRFTSIWDPRLIAFTDNKSAANARLINGSTYNGNNLIKLSSLRKTTEFGGAGVAKGADASTGGKASFQVKPAHIGICDIDIPAHELYHTIVDNTVLNSTEYGKVIIELAHHIYSGEAVVLPEDTQKNDKLRAAIQDNAGEYLGVLALIHDRSRFPRRASFEEWLGSSLTDLVLRFPSAETEALVDSFATISNANTNHSVRISSKGKNGGAAPAISTGLKIPDHIRRNPAFKNGVDFVDICINSSMLNQAFESIDLLYTVNPKSISKTWHNILPFNSKPKLKQSIVDQFKGSDIKLPAALNPIIASVDSKEANDGGKILYAIKKEVEVAVNIRDALPEFQAMVLDMLEMNFVQQYTDYQSKHTGELTFATQWPAKLDGSVTLENKCSAKDPDKNGFSFKLHRTDESVSSEPGVPEVDDTPVMPDVTDVAQDITKPKSSSNTKPQEPEPNIGRAKQKK